MGLNFENNLSVKSIESMLEDVENFISRLTLLYRAAFLNRFAANMQWLVKLLMRVIKKSFIVSLSNTKIILAKFQSNLKIDVEVARYLLHSYI